MTEDPTVAFLRELERADGAAAAVLTELDDLARDTETVRARAVELEARLIRLPAEREAAAFAVAAAEREAAEHGKALSRAEEELAAAESRRDQERLAAARRTHVRARDTLRMAERKLEAARAEERTLVAAAEEAEAEAAALEERAGQLARALRARPGLAQQAGDVPATGLAGVAEWGTKARAALFVARGRLASERDALLRQANELGAVVLGEPLGASSAAVVARRVEQASSADR